MEYKLEISKLLEKYFPQLSTEEIYKALEVPPTKDMGDYSFPCFKLSKILKKSPTQIAQEISSQIELPNYIAEVKVLSAYINFYLKREFPVKDLISKVLVEKENYGRSSIGNGKTIYIDYSSPNVAKLFHVGHLRTTVIGNALYKILEFIGYNCFGNNYLGDWGTQFGKLIVAYKKWGSKEIVEKDGILELNRLYVKFHEEAENDKSLEEDARNYLLKMQQNDPESMELWKWFKDISVEEYDRIYDRLNIKFDSYRGESYYNDKMDAVVDELREKHLLTESQGAQVVNLEEYGMPPCLILRRDGGTLYPTRDIAAVFDRRNEHNFYKCLYITALDQSLHFKQWFKVIELLGYDWADDLVHIPYGLVRLDSGKFASRKGNAILIEDLLDEAIAKTKKIIEEKNPNLEKSDEVASQVGLGAIIFNDLYNNRIKDEVFSWERMLNFEGETAPYVQYTHARACSIIEKAGDYSFDKLNYSILTDDASYNVIKVLESFSDKLIDSANKYEPFIVTRFLVELASAFNKFYHECPILNSEEETKTARLALTLCTKTVLKTGLNLLGIEAPQKM